MAFDGRPVAAQLDPKWAQRGVLFGSLDALVSEHGDLIRKHLFRAMNPHSDKFCSLQCSMLVREARCFMSRNAG